MFGVGWETLILPESSLSGLWVCSDMKQSYISNQNLELLRLCSFSGMFLVYCAFTVAAYEYEFIKFFTLSKKLQKKLHLVSVRSTVQPVRTLYSVNKQTHLCVYTAPLQTWLSLELFKQSIWLAELVIDMLLCIFLQFFTQFLFFNKLRRCSQALMKLKTYINSL